MANIFVFMGQNATTGFPNRITGRMSKFGFFHSFASKADRDLFIARNSHRYRGRIFESCNMRTGRKYKLGMTVRDYQEMLQSMPYWCSAGSDD